EPGPPGALELPGPTGDPGTGLGGSNLCSTLGSLGSSFSCGQYCSQLRPGSGIGPRNRGGVSMVTVTPVCTVACGDGASQSEIDPPPPQQPNGHVRQAEAHGGPRQRPGPTSTLRPQRGHQAAQGAIEPIRDQRVLPDRP